MKLFLHIGTEKTGTTTIQKALGLNRDRLLDNGIYVPLSLGRSSHSKLVVYAMRPGIADPLLPNGRLDHQEKSALENKIRKELHDEIHSIPSHVHTMIISCEHLHSRLFNIEEVQKVHELLQPHFSSISVVCYLRPQIDVATSLYTTALRHGCTRSIQSFIETHEKKKPLFYDYDQLLHRWELVFSKKNITVCHFNQKDFINHHLLYDFCCRALHLHSDFVDKLDLSIHKENKSLSKIGQSVLRLYNFAPRSVFEKAVSPNFSWRVIRFFSSIFSGKGQHLPNSFARIFQDKYKIENENVRSRYFPESNHLFNE